MRFKFLKTILQITVVFIALAAYPMIAWFDAAVSDAVLAAGIIAVVNILIGYVLLEFAIDKDHSMFMSVVFGGMAIRLMGILIALAALLFEGYNGLALALALMAFHVVYLIAEIRYVSSDMSKYDLKALHEGKVRIPRPVSTYRAYYFEKLDI